MGLVKAWDVPELPSVPFDRAYEAQCSTWIENENDFRTCLRALHEPSRNDLTVDMLLNMHRVLMKGRDDKFPGCLRPVNVRVGRYVAPPWQDVPRLMTELDVFLQTPEVPLLMKAVWGHLMFETIHPFADGNGRVGRLLVNKILGRPFATGVLGERPKYYELLDKGSWKEWSEWMVAVLRDAPRGQVFYDNPWA